MNADELIDRLGTGVQRLRPLFEGVDREQAVWKPSAETWSILEVAVHLLDEEREDFRPRLDLLLRSPGVLGPPINPQGWVTERRYNERDLAETLRELAAERERSLHWLRSLRDPAWDNTLQHPIIGTLRAGDLLASWAGHDLLHLRQLVRLHWLHLQGATRPFSTGYAGDW